MTARLASLLFLAALLATPATAKNKKAPRLLEDVLFLAFFSIQVFALL